MASFPANHLSELFRMEQRVFAPEQQFGSRMIRMIEEALEALTIGAADRRTRRPRSKARRLSARIMPA
jgi:hypothetical protein